MNDSRWFLFSGIIGRLKMRSTYLFNRLCLQRDLPSRTPGPLGINDQADPNLRTRLGITPGPLGMNDDADPNTIKSLHYLPRKARPANSSGYVIPQPHSSKPPLLSDLDIETTAKAYDVDAAAIYAVSDVESGGRTGFDSKGRPKVLFEARWFHQFTGGRYDYSHPYLSQATWAGARRFYGIGQWSRLLDAFSLDPKSALKSASWGKFQIMGFNHSGFKNVFEFCDAMFISEKEHLKSFVAYCQDHNLISFLRDKKWALCAKAYNGAAYKQNDYDLKLESAYGYYKKRSLSRQ
ncbi:N-acetylmuramidase family protein [Geomonas oryzisoli]|uniref:N-acetylmuramidase family protein n=1 Tax=Geomonas oryzisoli TaxID=2847992 RepID=A0ABX8J5W5_9BACT|nr:N-acetylmuramidase family protein [Geomonas oryzisoli]QWV92094.1 N-acetylmuramidase family protein [Geomonas oryzisoli]